MPFGKPLIDHCAGYHRVEEKPTPRPRPPQDSPHLIRPPHPDPRTGDFITNVSARQGDEMLMLESPRLHSEEIMKRLIVATLLAAGISLIAASAFAQAKPEDAIKYRQGCTG